MVSVISSTPTNRFSLSQVTLARGVLFTVAAVVLGVFAGYRLLGEGRDFLNYVTFYENIREFGEQGFFRFEPGFVWVATVFKLVLNAEVEFLLAVLASLSLLVKFALFSHHRRPVLTILFYLCCWYPLHEYTQIRAAVAFAFVFLAAEAFFNRRFVMFAALVAMGSLFHGSSLAPAVAIPVAWVLASFRLPMIIAAIAGGAAALGAVMQPLLVFAERLNPLAGTYAPNLEGYSVNLFSSVNILTVALLGAILFARSLTDRRLRTLFILVLFGLAVAVAFQSMPVFSHRLREMFLIFLVPLAFNARFTPRGLLQMSLATVLGAGTLTAHILQGIIWT